MARPRLIDLCATALLVATPLLGVSAQAAPVDVSVQVTGTSGDWRANFTFANNLSTATSLYFVGVKADGRHDAAPAPFIWAPVPSYNTSAAGGADVTYNNLWLDLSLTGLSSGTQLSGFTLPISTQEAPDSFQWFAMTRGQSVVDQFDFGTARGVGYQGVVHAAAVPEPETYLLLATGLVALYLFRRRTRSANAARGA